MLSYRHAFHAGNHADVFKHLVVSLLLQHLLQKDKPVCFLDTHAGAGVYDLSSVMARKNREHESGVSRLWGLTECPPDAAPYLDVIRSVNESGSLQQYPGSPRLFRHFMRPKDRLILCDLHSTEYGALKEAFHGDKQVAVHHLDGYQGLKAFLPPQERRGLVLCDPAFELNDERTRLLEAVKIAWKRWPTGIYAIWYPIQDLPTAEWFHRQLRRISIPRILCAELRVFPEDQPLRLNGSGMIIINPPWHLNDRLATVGPWLSRTLVPGGEGSFRLQWLAGE